MGNERKIVNVNSTDVVARIFGNYDINVRIIEQNFRVNIRIRPFVFHTMPRQSNSISNSS